MIRTLKTLKLGDICEVSAGIDMRLGRCCRGGPFAYTAGGCALQGWLQIAQLLPLRVLLLPPPNRPCLVKQHLNELVLDTIDMPLPEDGLALLPLDSILFAPW